MFNSYRSLILTLIQERIRTAIRECTDPNLKRRMRQLAEYNVEYTPDMKSKKVRTILKGLDIEMTDAIPNVALGVKDIGQQGKKTHKLVKKMAQQMGIDESGEEGEKKKDKEEGKKEVEQQEDRPQPEQHPAEAAVEDAVEEPRSKKRKLQIKDMDDCTREELVGWLTHYIEKAKHFHKGFAMLQGHMATWQKLCVDSCPASMHESIKAIAEQQGQQIDDFNKVHLALNDEVETRNP